MKSKLIIIPRMSAVIHHADGTTTDLGDLNRPGVKGRIARFKLFLRQRRNS